MHLTPELIKRMREVQKDFDQCRTPRNLKLKLRYELEVDELIKKVPKQELDMLTQLDLFSEEGL